MKDPTKEFSTWAETFFLASLCALYFFWSVDPEIMLLTTGIYAVLFMSVVLKFDTGGPFLTGLFISIFYLSFYGDYYHYNTHTSHIFSYPLFPLLAWPLALTLLAYYMNMLFEVFTLKKTEIKIIIAYGIYVMMLLFFEYSAYHYHRMQLTSHYDSLPFIDCMHTPPSMQITYFINGLIFFMMYFPMENMRRYAEVRQLKSR